MTTAGYGIGARRAAEEMAARLGITVGRDTIEILAERGLVARAGTFKGWQLYDTATLAAVTSADAADAETAAAARRLLNRYQARRQLGIRQADFDRLVTAGLIVPDKTEPGEWQGVVRLFLPATLAAFAVRTDIDWAAVYATPPNKRTPLYDLAEPYLVLAALARLGERRVRPGKARGSATARPR